MKKGFTLVEILIVIAVLGVLAATVVVAINPLEQIARAKDSEKKTNVANLFKGLQSGFVLGGGTYPPAASGWINSLVETGELKNNPSDTSTTVPCNPDPLSSEEAGIENGYCYKKDGAKAVVYTTLESDKELEGCTGTCDVAYYAISSETGTPQVLFGSTYKQPSTDGTVEEIYHTYRVFVTSTTYNGNLGGLSGADEKCRERANALNLGGTWIAWLSDGSNWPANRFTQSLTFPYGLLNGIQIADDWADLTDGSIDAPIDRDENNNQVPLDTRVHTGTTAQGQPSPNHCNGWTWLNSGTYGSTIGKTDLTSSEWSWYSSTNNNNCFSPYRLYCFEQ